MGKGNKKGKQEWRKKGEEDVGGLPPSSSSASGLRSDLGPQTGAPRVVTDQATSEEVTVIQVRWPVPWQNWQKNRAATMSVSTIIFVLR